MAVINLDDCNHSPRASVEIFVFVNNSYHSRLVEEHNYISENWLDNHHVEESIKKLGSYKVEDLLKEPARLQDEETSICDQTQELALTNYKTFIYTAECSRELSKQFCVIDSRLDDLLLTHIPDFEQKCQKFATETSEVNNLRKLNSLTLNRNAQLLEILELPQLMTSFLNDGLYEDALELALYVRKTYSRHPDIPIFKNIIDDVEKSWLSMLHKLLSQLREDISLPKCLQTVGLIRRMEVFNETELRLKFLQVRSVWLNNCLNVIPKDDATHHLNKVIEVTRVNLFNIVTQYRAIFSDDDPNFSSYKTHQVNQNVIFYSWIQNNINIFLDILEEDLVKGVSSIDSILGQCMYFGSSFSKVGCDFRTLLIPIFNQAIYKKFEGFVESAISNFNKNMQRFTLINKNHPGISWKNKSQDPLQPPDSLLEFYPLAEFLNNILTAFNELRLCPPLAIVNDVIKSVENSLVLISKSILVLYSQEQQAFNASAKDAFTRLCMVFADDLVPYIQKCVHIIFPLNILSSYLGVTIQKMEDEKISFINKDNVVAPIKDLLPTPLGPDIVEETTQIEDRNPVDAVVQGDHDE